MRKRVSALRSANPDRCSGGGGEQGAEWGQGQEVWLGGAQHRTAAGRAPQGSENHPCKGPVVCSPAPLWLRSSLGYLFPRQLSISPSKLETPRGQEFALLRAIPTESRTKSVYSRR